MHTQSYVSGALAALLAVIASAAAAAAAAAVIAYIFTNTQRLLQWQDTAQTVLSERAIEW